MEHFSDINVILGQSDRAFHDTELVVCVYYWSDDVNSPFSRIYKGRSFVDVAVLLCIDDTQSVYDTANSCLMYIFSVKNGWSVKTLQNIGPKMFVLDVFVSLVEELILKKKEGELEIWEPEENFRTTLMNPPGLGFLNQSASGTADLEIQYDSFSKDVVDTFSARECFCIE